MPDRDGENIGRSAILDRTSSDHSCALRLLSADPTLPRAC